VLNTSSGAPLDPELPERDGEPSFEPAGELSFEPGGEPLLAPSHSLVLDDGLESGVLPVGDPAKPDGLLEPDGLCDPDGLFERDVPDGFFGREPGLEPAGC
jgi:hypothetical protein